MNPARSPDQGYVHALLAVTLLAVLAAAGVGIDAGAALAGQRRAHHIAAEAARAGAQQLDTVHYHHSGQAIIDPSAAVEAAMGYLAAAGAHGHVEATTTQVSVTVEHTQPTRLWQLIGIDELTVTAAATAALRHGITGPADLP
jgi:uncharacterized membrane protein